MKSYKTVIIIGAPRSGTNMLRDLLCDFKRVGTWPCDEINYIWRHGNVGFDTDELSDKMASGEVKRFITKKFDQLANENGLDFLIEKTCANSLRVPFVDQIIPDATYIFMVRDGLDVVESASIRWQATLDIPYVLKKARYIPFFDIPFYGFRYFGNRLYKLLSKDKRLSFWGPRFDGFQKIVQNSSLEEVCAIQWQRCVNLSEDALKQIPNDRVIKVRYEDFVLRPNVELGRILSRLGICHTVDEINKIVKVVSSVNIGKGRQRLDKSKSEKVSKLISKTLKMNGYEL